MADDSKDSLYGCTSALYAENMIVGGAIQQYGYLFEFEGKKYNLEDLQKMEYPDLDALRKRTSETFKIHMLDYFKIQQITIYNLITGIMLEQRLEQEGQVIQQLYNERC